MAECMDGWTDRRMDVLINSFYLFQDVIEQMNDMGPDKSGASPKHTIKITNCDVKNVEPYQLSRKFMLSDDPNNEL